MFADLVADRLTREQEGAAAHAAPSSFIMVAVFADLVAERFADQVADLTREVALMYGPVLMLSLGLGPPGQIPFDPNNQAYAPFAAPRGYSCNGGGAPQAFFVPQYGGYGVGQGVAYSRPFTQAQAPGTSYYGQSPPAVVSYEPYSGPSGGYSVPGLTTYQGGYSPNGYFARPQYASYQGYAPQYSFTPQYSFPGQQTAVCPPGY